MKARGSFEADIHVTLKFDNCLSDGAIKSLVDANIRTGQTILTILVVTCTIPLIFWLAYIKEEESYPHI